MLKPLADRIVVLPDPAHTLASDVIHIPNTKGIVDSQAQYGRVGTVVAIGPGKIDGKGRRSPVGVSVGNRVTWGEFAFPEYHEAGTIYAVIQEADITGIVEPEAEAA